MVHNVYGLLISPNQIHEMASHLSQKPVTELVLAYQVCHAEALKFQARWVPVDYPQNSDAKKTSIVTVLVLYEHSSKEKVDAKRSNRTKLARTAKEWLKMRGVSGTTVKRSLLPVVHPCLYQEPDLSQSLNEGFRTVLNSHRKACHNIRSRFDYCCRPTTVFVQFVILSHLERSNQTDRFLILVR
jgi:hypothetical protein